MEVIRRLRERGVELSNSVVRGGARLLDRQIGYEVTRFVFGRDAEVRRRTRDDAQVDAALQLLAGARTLEELLGRVGDEQLAGQRNGSQ